MNKLNPFDYANARGARCPRCLEVVTYVATGDATYVEHTVPRKKGKDRGVLIMYFGPINCVHCGYVWTDKFVLIGYENGDRNAAKE